VAAAQYNGMWEGLGLGDLEKWLEHAEVEQRRGRTISRTGGRQRERAIFQFFPLCTLMFFYFEILYNSIFCAIALVPNDSSATTACFENIRHEKGINTKLWNGTRTS
jgi:hypothetical protein